MKTRFHCSVIENVILIYFVSFKWSMNNHCVIFLSVVNLIDYRRPIWNLGQETEIYSVSACRLIENAYLGWDQNEREYENVFSERIIRTQILNSHGKRLLKMLRISHKWLFNINICIFFTSCEIYAPLVALPRPKHEVSSAYNTALLIPDNLAMRSQNSAGVNRCPLVITVVLYRITCEQSRHRAIVNTAWLLDMDGNRRSAMYIFGNPTPEAGTKLNGRYLGRRHFKTNFLYDMGCVLIHILLKFVSRSPNNNLPTMV